MDRSDVSWSDPTSKHLFSLMGGQLSVPSRCTAGLLTARVTSGHGDPALLSWVDPVLGNLGLPLLVGLGSTGTWQYNYMP